VNLVAFELLFAEIVRYTQQRVDGIGEFEKKLSTTLSTTKILTVYKQEGFFDRIRFDSKQWEY
jgi:hypothetical protein